MQTREELELQLEKLSTEALDLLHVYLSLVTDRERVYKNYVDAQQQIVDIKELDLEVPEHIYARAKTFKSMLDKLSAKMEKTNEQYLAKLQEADKVHVQLMQVHAEDMPQLLKEANKKLNKAYKRLK